MHGVCIVGVCNWHSMDVPGGFRQVLHTFKAWKAGSRVKPKYHQLYSAFVLLKLPHDAMVSAACQNNSENFPGLGLQFRKSHGGWLAAPIH